MPLYEYTCDDDGSSLTLLRTMSAADDPVEDPEGTGRLFKRTQSTFQVDTAKRTGSTSPMGPGCACGHGGCGH
ncbi:MAG: zinc ribbon domain-containing protein [Planctomycetota bacterium]|nr:zinc ribbon domain-containing protein [Planctomycetota bacterium]